MEKVSRMEFTTQHIIADVGTAYLTERDLDLLADAPNHLAVLDNQAGHIYYTPREGMGQGTAEEFVDRAREHGMSERFIQVLLEAGRQGIPYIRFDANAGEIDGWTGRRRQAA